MEGQLDLVSIILAAAAAVGMVDKIAMAFINLIRNILRLMFPPLEPI